MEWNRRNVLVLIVLVLVGFGAGGVLYVKQEGGTSFTVFRIQRWALKLNGGAAEVSPSEIRRAEEQAVKAAQRVLVLHPELKIEAKPIPHARNGFLAIIQFKDDPRMLDLVRSQITSKMDGKVVDVEAIEKELKSHEAILAEIERVASLPERSSEDLPVVFDRSMGAREIKVMGEYLMWKARLAAMRKNEQEAFKYVSLTVNLSEHLNEIGSPNLLMEAVLILVRLHVREQVMEYVLPEIGQSADLVKWRELLKPRDQIAERYSALLRGEFNYIQKQWLKLVFISRYEYEIPDPEAFFLSYAAYTEANIKSYKGMSFQAFSKSSPLPGRAFTKGLSKESIRMLSVMNMGVKHRNRGMIRAYLVEAQVDAALDLLIREKAGEDLSKLTETFVLNPESGKPFVFDPLKRLLPEDSAQTLDELKLPW